MNTRPAVPGLRATPVSHPFFGPDPPAMSLDDLAGNRKPEPGILPEALGPVGIETIEYFRQRLRPDTGAVVIDDDFDFVTEPPPNDAHLATFRREGAGVLHEIADDVRDARA